MAEEGVLLDGKPAFTTRGENWVCMICERMFPSKDKLNIHVKQSKLHSTNFRAAVGAQRITGAVIPEERRVAETPIASTSSSSLEAMMAFERKMSGGTGPRPASGPYRDRAKERRETIGGDDRPGESSVKRARDINNNIDWRCSKCDLVNFARVIVCNKCGAEVDENTEYVPDIAQHKRHKAMMTLARATGAFGKLPGDDDGDESSRGDSRGTRGVGSR